MIIEKQAWLEIKEMLNVFKLLVLFKQYDNYIKRRCLEYLFVRRLSAKFGE